MNTTFPENLQRLRKAAGLSQEQLAERIGVSRQAISKWETGETAPEMGKLLQLCQVLSCGLDTLCFSASEGESAAASAGASLPPAQQHRTRRFGPILALLAALLLGLGAGYLLWGGGNHAAPDPQSIPEMCVTSCTEESFNRGGTLYLTLNVTTDSLWQEDWTAELQCSPTGGGEVRSYPVRQDGGFLRGTAVLEAGQSCLLALTVSSQSGQQRILPIMKVNGITENGYSSEPLWENRK